mgnify:CR=1 FL=1
MTRTRHEPFSGFERRSSTTPVPEKFFTRLLPLIDDLGELKLTLYAFWSLAQQQSQFPYLSRKHMLQDNVLLEALASPGPENEQALDDALQQAIQRGTLLHAGVDGQDDYYFMNSTRGRQAAEAIRNGTWQPEFEPQPLMPVSDRPNIFILYEQNIGPITPMIGETLKDAEDEFPRSWVEEAFRIAVSNNVRKWSYIEAILKDWQDRGKDERGHRPSSRKTKSDYTKGWFDE